MRWMIFRTVVMIPDVYKRQMLGIEDEKIADQLSAMKKDMVEKVIEKDKKLQAQLGEL